MMKRLNDMRWAILGTLASLASLATPSFVVAQQAERTAVTTQASEAQPEMAIAEKSAAQVLDRVRSAYRVDRLRAASTIRLEEEIRQEYPNHDYSPDFHELSAQRRHHVIDFERELGSSEYLTKIAGSYYHGRSVFADGGSRFIIYPSGVVQDQVPSEFLSEYGGTIRSSDAMVALWLDRIGDTARFEGEEMWLGKYHDRITIDFSDSPPLTVLIQQDSGYISKMWRRVGDENILVSYIFDYHTVQNGVPLAREHTLYIGSERLFYSFNRRIILDDPTDAGAFEVEADLVPEPRRVDQSELTAEALTGALFHVGQDEAYTAFITTAQGLVAFGVQAGFADRLQAYRDASLDTTPLAYAVIPNHHNVRLGGAEEALNEGAVLLVTASAQGRVRDRLVDESLAERVETISESKSIGSLTVHNVATSTASENLIAFNTADRALIETGHYGAPFIDRPVWASLTGVTLLQSLGPLDLSPAYLISTESRRAESWSLFEAQVASFVEIPCARARPICEEWQ